MSIPVPDSPDATSPVGPVDRHDEVELLEFDETVPPRPEEEIADVARALPDPSGHGAPSEGTVTAREVP